MIRLAAISDIPRLVEMGARFREQSTYKNHLAEDKGQLEVMAKKLVDVEGMLVCEVNGAVVGMIGFIVFPHFLSGETVAGEVVWWVEPEHRGAGPRLMRAAEKKAAEQGAKKMQMIAPNDRVGKLYEHFGYAFVESAYQKDLCQK